MSEQHPVVKDVSVDLGALAQPSAEAGFDSAVKDREGDCLNRWPIAQEIYGIATTGPPGWSVRVGLYGAWGTGKTSVLEFIAYMAKQDGQCLIKFNPWRYSTKNALWEAFVLTVFSEPALQNVAGRKIKVAKGWFSKLMSKSSVAQTGVSILNDKAGRTLGVGLDLVKNLFSFGPDDLRQLQKHLRNRRVIVIIDDLDRTAPDLVPEILFALKELMDIPGFAFIAAFDPAVVGETLARYHPGFGDGLDFLEKIIDYPRWLPDASEAGLAKLAIKDAENFCSYVPKEALQEAITFLPRNPRAVRQFIRLIALLKPQIQRHHASELHWPVILAANAIKVRQSKLASALLGDKEFWGSIEFLPFSAKDGEKEAELNDVISKHVDKCAAACRVQLEPTERTEIFRALRSISSRIVTAWFGSGVDTLIYQMNVAESPHAVTWKEFEEFIERWNGHQAPATITAWIEQHSRCVMRSTEEIYHEILLAAR
ncbi:MAG TPA: P-loop NTPase fold protein [Verrucomicrobiae bacterium]|nr:P-loop NTPase fold protein [Verrucomicrobiae bacterium]